MKSEYIANVEIRDAVSVNLISGESRVRLLRVEVDIRGNGCVCFAVDSLARRKSDDKVGTDDLLWSLRHGDRKRSRLGMRNRLEPLTLFTASDVLVDEGAH